MSLRRRLRQGWVPAQAIEYPQHARKPGAVRAPAADVQHYDTAEARKAQQRARDEATGVEELRRQIEEIQAIVQQQREDLAQHKRSSIEWQRYALRCETQAWCLVGSCPTAGASRKRGRST